MSECLVHPTAIISPQAQIASNVKVGPYCVIGSQVIIGEGSILHSHVVVDGNTKIGSDNVLFPFCSVGLAPQDLKYHGENSILDIGDGNIIREYATLQPGTEGGGNITKVGNKNLFMACSHVGHDCHVGDGNILANSVALAGHVTVGSYVTLGGMVGVHQFTRLGDYCFLGAGSMVAKDIPPYAMAGGDRAKISGVNSIGLQRKGFSSDAIKSIRKAYRMLFSSQALSTLFSERIERVQEALGTEDAVSFLLQFVRESKRGVASSEIHTHED